MKFKHSLMNNNFSNKDIIEVKKFLKNKDVILKEYQQLFLMNPIANLIKNYRQVLMENALPDWSALAVICIVSVALIIAMTLYFKKTGKLYARLIVQ